MMKTQVWLDSVEKEHLSHKRVPQFAPGDVVKVHLKIKEGEKERIQAFEGVVITRRGSGTRESFKVRRIASGVGVERTFMLHSPLIEKLQVVKHGQVARAKLYFLRGKTGKKAKIKLLQRDKLLQLQESERQAMEAEQAASALQAEVRSQTTRLFWTVRVSSSRAPGAWEPTPLMWLPALSHRPSSTGVEAVVARMRISAWATAAAGSSAMTTGTPIASVTRAANCRRASGASRE